MSKIPFNVSLALVGNKYEMQSTAQLQHPPHTPFSTSAPRGGGGVRRFGSASALHTSSQ